MKRANFFLFAMLDDGTPLKARAEKPFKARFGGPFVMYGSLVIFEEIIPALFVRMILHEMIDV